jgi:hypothetical protein
MDDLQTKLMVLKYQIKYSADVERIMAYLNQSNNGQAAKYEDLAINIKLDGSNFDEIVKEFNRIEATDHKDSDIPSWVETCAYIHNASIFGMDVIKTSFINPDAAMSIFVRVEDAMRLCVDLRTLDIQSDHSTKVLNSIERIALGFDSMSRMDDHIDNWHKCNYSIKKELHEYLGLNSEQYGKFIKDPNALVEICEEVKKDLPAASLRKKTI